MYADSVAFFERQIELLTTRYWSLKDELNYNDPETYYLTLAISTAEDALHHYHNAIRALQESL